MKKILINLTLKTFKNKSDDKRCGTAGCIELHSQFYKNSFSIHLFYVVKRSEVKNVVYKAFHESKYWYYYCYCYYYVVIHLFNLDRNKNVTIKKLHSSSYKSWIMNGGGLYHIETSPLILRSNQWTGFYMIETLSMNE